MSACHLCGTPLDGAPVVGTMARYEKPSRRVICPRCTLVQVSPQPSESEIAAYYDGEFWRTDGAKAVLIFEGEAHEQGTEGHERAATVRAELFVKRLLDDTGIDPSSSTLIEIGCGDGRTLAALREAGFDVTGVEPDERMARIANERTGGEGRVIHGEATDAVGQYDIVCAWHVLEHQRDPLAFLGELRRLARPGGVVYVEVPNVLDPMGPLAENWWQWAHLFDFSPHTLFGAMRCAGLDRATVVAGPWSVRAWGYSGDDGRREWAPTGHEDASAVVRLLADHDARHRPAPTKTVLERFLEGESVADLASLRVGDTDQAGDLQAVEREIRREIARWRDAVNRMAKAYRDATDMVGTIGDQLDAGGVERLESWHPDPYVHGFTMGEGNAMLRARSLLAYLGNAMRMREIGDAAWEEKA